MFGVGGQELVIILLVALIVFGPRRLPEIGRSLGRGLNELRKASRDLTDSLQVDEIETDRTKETAQK